MITSNFLRFPFYHMLTTRMIQIQMFWLASVNVKPTPKVVNVMFVRMAILTSKQVTQLVVLHADAYRMAPKTGTFHVTQHRGSVTAKTG